MTRSLPSGTGRRIRCPWRCYPRAVKRTFVIVGQKAVATNDFRLDDVPGTSGRLDVLLRCLRAAFLSSHGLRQEVRVYLVLLTGPRVVRFDGAGVRFLRPDERSLAVLAQKVLVNRADDAAAGFVEVRPGISLARGGLEVALDDATGTLLLLDEAATEDVRRADLPGDVVLVIGDHLGLPEEARALVTRRGARALHLGPVSVHADDAIAIVTNELDRRELQARCPTSPGAGAAPTST